MKKIPILSVVLLSVFCLSCLPVFAATDDAVFVSETGADTNNGSSASLAVATLGKAYQILGSTGGTIVVCGKVTISSAFTAPQHTGGITITSKHGGINYADSGAVLEIGAFITLNGPTNVNNIKIHETKTTQLIACNGYRTVFDEGITCTRASESNFIWIGLTAGRSDNEACNGTNLTINSGTWNMVRAGSRGTGQINGDLYLEINGGTFYGNIEGSGKGVTTGNSTVLINNITMFVATDGKSSKILLGGNEEGEIKGNATLTIKGGTYAESPEIKGVSDKVAGTTTIDYSGYGGVNSLFLLNIAGFDKTISESSGSSTTTKPDVTNPPTGNFDYLYFITLLVAAGAVVIVAKKTKLDSVRRYVRS